MPLCSCDGWNECNALIDDAHLFLCLMEYTRRWRKVVFAKRGGVMMMVIAIDDETGVVRTQLTTFFVPK